MSVHLYTLWVHSNLPVSTQNLGTVKVFLNRVPGFESGVGVFVDGKWIKLVFSKYGKPISKSEQRRFKTLVT